jgi:HEAT repeat protein
MTNNSQAAIDSSYTNNAATDDPIVWWDLSKLAEHPSPELITNALDLLQSQHPENRITAALSLRVLLRHASSQAVDIQVPVAALETTLSDEDRGVRVEGAMALASLENRNPLVADILYEISAEDIEQDYIAVLDTATALARLRDARAVEPLVKLLAFIGECVKIDSFEDLDLTSNTRQIISSLRDLTAPEATDAMIVALNHESEYLRDTMAKVLGCSTRHSVVNLLRLFAEDDSKIVRDAVREALAKYGG